MVTRKFFSSIRQRMAQDLEIKGKVEQLAQVSQRGGDAPSLEKLKVSLDRALSS